MFELARYYWELYSCLNTIILFLIVKRIKSIKSNCHKYWIILLLKYTKKYTNDGHNEWQVRDPL